MDLTAAGHTGQVHFDGAFVTITRKGFLARSTVGKGEKRIPLASITAVQWKPPGGLVNGFIQFTVGGGTERRSGFGSQTTSAVKDENSVVVTKKQGPEFELLRKAVEDAIAAHHTRPATPVAASGAEEVSRLVALRDAGHLSDDEFAAAKAKALGL